MGKLFKQYLYSKDVDDIFVYRCATCRTHLSTQDYFESDAFRSNEHKAFLVGECFNVTFGPTMQRVLTTGRHLVQDIYCLDCEAQVGWKYIWAHRDNQKYKEGKYILVSNQLYNQQIQQDPYDNEQVASSDQEQNDALVYRIHFAPDD